MAHVLTAQEIYKKALTATVRIDKFDGGGKRVASGSGFVVRPNLIATNFHVIKGGTSTQLAAKFVNQNRVYPIEDIRAVDEIHDLAILQVSVPGVKPLPLGDSDVVEVGDDVYVVGNPLGLEGSFADGRISAIREHVSWGAGKRIQYSAPTSKGSSGGPALNNKGEVIGVHVEGLRHLAGENLNFAIPSNYLKDVIPKKPKPSKPDETKSDTPKAAPKKNNPPKPIWAILAAFGIIATVIVLIVVFAIRSCGHTSLGPTPPDSDAILTEPESKIVIPPATPYVSVSINAVPWAEVFIKTPGSSRFIKPGPKYFNIKPKSNGKDAHVTPIRGKLKVPAGTAIKLVYEGREEIFPYETWKTRRSISHDFPGEMTYH